MEEIDGIYYLVIVLWLVAFAILIAQAWIGQRPVVGLSLAYLFSLAMIHFLGGVIQIFPWHVSFNKTLTIIGFRLTGYAILAFLIGNALVAPWLFTGHRLPIRPIGTSSLMGKVAREYIVIGLAVHFALATFFAFLPSTRAVLSGGLSLAVGGFTLLWWYYWTTGKCGKTWLVPVAALILPASTLLGSGFLGQGVNGLVCLGLFIGVYYRPRATALVVGLAALFIGLSLYPTYLKGRTAIRQAVWGGKSYEERVEVTVASLEDHWSWFDLREETQLEAIENRLNQNYLVGAAYRRLTEGMVPFAGLETFSNSILALVPRVFWPNKPVWAGSGGLVTHFTGIQFASGTSVGIGHIMELYVSFGEPALWIGFIIIGIIIGIFDYNAAAHLRAGNIFKFMLWFVPGLALLQVGGNFAEMTGAAAGYTILCLLVNRLIKRIQFA